MSGGQFKQIIKEKGMKQNEVAKEIGLSSTTLNGFLNGRLSELSKSKYYRLADYLGLDIHNEPIKMRRY